MPTEHSVNAAGEPIVCTPGDAVRTFLATGLDILVCGDFIAETTERVRRLPGPFSLDHPRRGVGHIHGQPVWCRWPAEGSFGRDQHCPLAAK